jgi:hypothetical protein
VKPSKGYTIDLRVGKYNVNVVSDIFGADPEIIKELDLAVSSKVVEICEKRGIECHLLEPLQIIY